MDYGSYNNNFILFDGKLAQSNFFFAEKVLFSHLDLAFDLMSLDIEFLVGESLISSSSGASLSLDDFGLGTAVFNSTGWQNITSFSIETSGLILLDNIVFENPPTVVPEPSTFILLGGGLVGLAFFARRRKNS